MIVVAGGMIRSGSTFAFNIARELLTLSAPVRAVSADSMPNFEWSGQAQHLIIKSHIPDEGIVAAIAEGSAACICTVRRAEDAIASWVRTFDLSVEHGIEMIRRWHA